MLPRRLVEKNCDAFLDEAQSGAAKGDITHCRSPALRGRPEFLSVKVGLSRVVFQPFAFVLAERPHPSVSAVQHAIDQSRFDRSGDPGHDPQPYPDWPGVSIITDVGFPFRITSDVPFLSWAAQTRRSFQGRW